MATVTPEESRAAEEELARRSDDRSERAKIFFLEAIGQTTVPPVAVSIPLDVDLCNLYSLVAPPPHVMSAEEVLLVQVIRLLRGQVDVPSTNGSAPAAVIAGPAK